MYIHIMLLGVHVHRINFTGKAYTQVWRTELDAQWCMNKEWQSLVCGKFEDISEVLQPPPRATIAGSKFTITVFSLDSLSLLLSGNYKSLTVLCWYHFHELVFFCSSSLPSCIGWCWHALAVLCRSVCYWDQIINVFSKSQSKDED